MKKNEVRRLMLPDFNTYYKAIVIKTVSYWIKTDQWDRMKSRNRPTYMWPNAKLCYAEQEKLYRRLHAL